MNEELKNKIGTVFVYIFFIVALLSFAATFPYKEVLQCNETDCSVNRFYIFSFLNTTYNFNSNDNLEAVYHSGRRASHTNIENASNYNNVFENGFASTVKAEDVINVIKNGSHKIKITKYWFGCKIEEF